MTGTMTGTETRRAARLVRNTALQQAAATWFDLVDASSGHERSFGFDAFRHLGYLASPEIVVGYRAARTVNDGFGTGSGTGTQYRGQCGVGGSGQVLLAATGNRIESKTDRLCRVLARVRDMARRINKVRVGVDRIARHDDIEPDIDLELAQIVAHHGYASGAADNGPCGLVGCGRNGCREEHSESDCGKCSNGNGSGCTDCMAHVVSPFDMPAYYTTIRIGVNTTATGAVAEGTKGVIPWH